jgi:maltose alpha-D-glucosyltransferase/alpha-amylase
VGPLYASVVSGRLDASLATFLAQPRADFMPMILGNHDAFAGDRVWNRLNGDIAAYRLLASAYLLSSRTPFAYYGEDIGMAGGNGLSGDTALRTPMSWTADATTAGFTSGTPFRALSANSSTRNVALQLPDTTSLLQHYRALLNLRKSHPVLAEGNLSLQSAANDPVLEMARESGSECAAIFINFSNASQASQVDTSCDGATFDNWLAAGSVAADAQGRLSVTVPARSALAYGAVH